MRKKELLQLSDSALDRAVKTQGTDFDRRRKITKNMAGKITRAMNKKDANMTKLAKELGVERRAIRYLLDEEYREREHKRLSKYKYSSSKSGALQERATYKRELVKSNKRITKWFK